MHGCCLPRRSPKGRSVAREALATRGGPSDVSTSVCESRRNIRHVFIRGDDGDNDDNHGAGGGGSLYLPPSRRSQSLKNTRKPPGEAYRCLVTPLARSRSFVEMINLRPWAVAVRANGIDHSAINERIRPRSIGLSSEELNLASNTVRNTARSGERHLSLDEPPVAVLFHSMSFS